MKLPKEIDIMGIIYEVEEVEVVNKMIPRNGEIDFQEQKIRLDKNLLDDRKMVTLLHEVIHGEMEALGFDELCDNENVVQSLAVALYHTFKHLTIQGWGGKEEEWLNG